MLIEDMEGIKMADKRAQMIKDEELSELVKEFEELRRQELDVKFTYEHAKKKFLKEGKEEGLKEGKQRGKLEILKQKLNNGIDIDIILKAGFTKKEIDQLR